VARPGGLQPASSALLTDHYELTMLRAAVADGTVARRTVFEVFARSLPPGRRYGVVAGLGRVLDAVRSFRFTAEQIAHLVAGDVVDQPTADYLADLRFRGDIDGYAEGEAYFANSPVLTVSGTFGECILLETVVLSILNHDSSIASAASRMVVAAAGRGLLEMGTRRTHELAAPAAARAAYIAGFAATSNLSAGQLYGVPTRGTAAHAFTLVHPSEKSAFASLVAALGPGTTLLVDTYDVPAAITTAVEVAGRGLGGIRIDSGDLFAQAVAARAQLDALGATGTRIVVTGDLDEHAIAALAEAPVDLYGVGTRLVTGSGHPTAGMVYKLVALSEAAGADVALRPVAKRSLGKETVGGRKVAVRRLDAGGQAVAEEVVVLLEADDGQAGPGRSLQVAAMRDGEVVHRPTLEQMRAHHRAVLGELTDEDLDLSPGTPRLFADPGGDP
jgi:nicotinate phosphoribosyltransferase